MDTLNIHEAKTHLSRLIERVARGGTVIIAKAGRPVARLVPVRADLAVEPQRLGFLAGEMRVPDDFDRMGEEAIEALFALRS